MSEPFSFRSFIRRKRNSSSDRGKARELTTTSPTHQTLQEENAHHGKEGDLAETRSAPSSKEEPTRDRYGLILLSKESSTGEAPRKHTVDVVAVHGLGGDAYTTWTNGNGKLWLRDLLPDDLPGARVFTFGYNSAFAFSRETSTLREYARALLEDIRCERTLLEEKNCPLIFVCHSMGGIIVKQALLISKNESELYPGFNASVSGVLFLGTPHQGSPSATYATILSQIANVLVIGGQVSRLAGPIRTELLHSLRANEKELLHIAQDFRVHTGKLQITSFIEQKNTRGLNQRIVDETSGFMGVPTERLVPMSDCDHREICKPGGRDSNYKKLLVSIRDGAPVCQPVAQSPQGNNATGQSPHQHVSQTSVSSHPSTLPQKGTKPFPQPRKPYIRPGWTILHSVAEKNDIVSVQRAISSGIEPNASTIEEGWTPLWLASHYGCFEAVQVLLAAGANVDATAKDGSTPLLRAAVLGAVKVVEELLKHSASVEGSGYMAELGTPLLCAAMHGHIEIVKVLLKNGASCQAQTRDKFTALHCALGAKHQQVAEVLLDAAHPVNVITSTGLTPLHMAVMHGSLDLVQRILDLQANIDPASESGLTPVRMAVQLGKLDMVKLLLARGARDDIQPEDGFTLMEVALMTKDVEMYLFLEKRSSAV